MFEPGQQVWLYYGDYQQPEPCIFVIADPYKFNPTRVLVQYKDSFEGDDPGEEDSSELYPTLVEALTARTICLTRRECLAKRELETAQANLNCVTDEIEKSMAEIRRLQGDIGANRN